MVFDYSEEVHGYIELKTNINRCTQKIGYLIMCKVRAQPCRFILEMFSKDFEQLHTFCLKTLISETT